MSERPALPMQKLRRRARHVLLAESAWPALRLPLGMAGAWLIAGLARIPQTLPDWLHATIELGWLGFGGLRIIRAMRQVEEPTARAIDRRIEEASRLPHQPLLALQDRPALAGQPGLWDAHIARTLHALGPMRTGFPQPDLTRRDQWLGLGLIGALAVMLAAAGNHAPSRIAASLRPGWDDADVPLPEIQAWIDMPSFSPGAPIFLQNGSQADPGLARQPPDIPVHAILHVTMTGLAPRPRIRGIESPDLRPLDRGSWQASGSFMRSGHVTIRARGRTLADWPVKVLADAAPVITWGKTPGAHAFRTDLPWQAAQSYGMDTLIAEIRHAGSTRVLRVPIPLSGHPKNARGTLSPDLSADPWAGDEVTATLHGRSTSGKDGVSGAATFKLGARTFHDPLARALIELRRRMALDEEPDQAASDELAALLQAPKLAQARPGAYAGLSMLANQLGNPDLLHAAPDGAHAEAIGVLWYLALYLEDRRYESEEEATASLDIRAAQEQVQAQLEHMRDLGPKGHTEAEQAELGKRTQTLRDAIQRRMELLARRAMGNGVVMPESMGGSSDEVQRMMRDLQSDAANGRNEEAMRKLQDMEDMAERMRNAKPQDLQNLARQMQAHMQAQQQSQAIHDLIHRESGLLDHAQKRLEAQKNAQKQAEDAQGTDGDTEGADANGSGQNGPDLAHMPTAELLRRLGLQAPSASEDAEAPPLVDPKPDPQAGIKALSPEMQQAQSDERAQDHAVSHALTRAVQALSRETHELTGKDAKNLANAHDDMVKDSKALLVPDDTLAQKQAQAAIRDLAQASKEMQQSQAQKGAGQPVLLPGLGMGHSQGHGEHEGESDENGQEEGDQASKGDRDPLGRHTGEGQDNAHSDTKLSDQQQRDRAREIQRELERRDADKTRPRDELNYLDRLLQSF